MFINDPDGYAKTGHEPDAGHWVQTHSMFEPDASHWVQTHTMF